MFHRVFAISLYSGRSCGSGLLYVGEFRSRSLCLVRWGYVGSSERVGVAGERSVGRRIIAIITASPIPSLVSF
nr:MAG TPA: hypothetical protein [Bacteriophage sp.]